MDTSFNKTKPEFVIFGSCNQNTRKWGKGQLAEYQKLVTFGGKYGILSLVNFKNKIIRQKFPVILSFCTGGKLFRGLIIMLYGRMTIYRDQHIYQNHTAGFGVLKI